MHKLADWENDVMSFFYGDGAGAAILAVSDKPGFVSSTFFADGSYHKSWGIYSGGTAGPASDIDMLLHVTGSEHQRRELELWLEGWSLCLAQINYLRTGYRSDGLLDVHFVTDDDIARQTSFAVKIGAVTDAARPLLLPPNSDSVT